MVVQIILNTHLPSAVRPSCSATPPLPTRSLFCRIITEGLFGLRVTGWKKLRVSLKKRNISLSGLKLFGETFSISENGNGIVITTETEMYQTDQLEAVFDFEKRNFI